MLPQYCYLSHILFPVTKAGTVLLFIDIQCSGLLMRSCKPAVRSSLPSAQSCPSWDWQTGLRSLCLAVLWLCKWAGWFDPFLATRATLKFLGWTWGHGSAFSVQLPACYACKGQNLHLELVIKTQQELINVRIADGLCGQGKKGWQVRTCSSGDCCALFPPWWLSSMIKEKISLTLAVVHVLKLFGVLASKPTSSCILLTCIC